MPDISVSNSTDDRYSRWKDGRRFSTRVQVCSNDNPDRFLFRIHAEGAYQLCKAKIASVACDDKKIWRIRLLRPAPKNLRVGGPRPFTLFSFGTRYTYLDVLGADPTRPIRRMATYAFRFVHDRDNWAYPGHEKKFQDDSVKS